MGFWLAWYLMCGITSIFTLELRDSVQKFFDEGHVDNYFFLDINFFFKFACVFTAALWPMWLIPSKEMMSTWSKVGEWFYNRRWFFPTIAVLTWVFMTMRP